ncbi:hypothetical protein BDV10DRAFT_121885 [Aspergillus recurvatus]
MLGGCSSSAHLDINLDCLDFIVWMAYNRLTFRRLLLFSFSPFLLNTTWLFRLLVPCFVTLRP